MNLHKLQKRINYEFKNIDLLTLALSHKSSNNTDNNERLEFLGDSILNSVISQYLFLKFPLVKEGQLTRMRSYLVKGETLTKKANQINLIDHICLSKGTSNLSSERKSSILEGTIESIIGAVFLDSSWEQVNIFVLNFFNDELSQIKSDQEFRDSKTELQELLQSKKLNPPNYVTEDSTKGFNSQIKINKENFSSFGRSKRQAEIAVAKQALKYFKDQNG
ncbi:MAG: ribonuclease III [Gammaproteobacteria bacterium]|nr:ribonuclease III [Gammaproteobacteria bacterium]